MFHQISKEKVPSIEREERNHIPNNEDWVHMYFYYLFYIALFMDKWILKYNPHLNFANSHVSH